MAGKTSRVAEFKYEFLRETPNSGRLLLTETNVHVKVIQASDMDNASILTSLCHSNFLKCRFADSLDKSQEVCLVFDRFDYTVMDYFERLKREGITFYSCFEVPCEKGAGVKYTAVHPIYRRIIKELIDSLFFLHEEKKVCTKEFTAQNLVVCGDVVCFYLTDFVGCSVENRANDMTCLKKVLDEWFPPTGCPPSMNNLKSQLVQFKNLLVTYGSSIREYFSNHVAVMDPIKRLQFIKNCSDKSNSAKFNFIPFRNAVRRIGNKNGWVGRLEAQPIGPLYDILHQPLLLMKNDRGNDIFSPRITYRSSGDVREKQAKEEGNYGVNRSLITFWRHSATHLHDHMARHILAKRKRIIEESKKQGSKASRVGSVDEQTEAQMKIFEDMDIELSIMALYDNEITTFYNNLFKEKILHVFV